jgi:hypothetical protein
MNAPKIPVDPSKLAKVNAIRGVAPMRFATGRQATLAYRLNGKPATRKHGKPTRG